MRDSERGVILLGLVAVVVGALAVGGAGFLAGRQAAQLSEPESTLPDSPAQFAGHTPTSVTLEGRSWVDGGGSLTFFADGRILHLDTAGARLASDAILFGTVHTTAGQHPFEIWLTNHGQVGQLPGDWSRVRQLQLEAPTQAPRLPTNHCGNVNTPTGALTVSGQGTGEIRLAYDDSALEQCGPLQLGGNTTLKITGTEVQEGSSTSATNASCNNRFAVVIESSSPVRGPGEPPDSAEQVLYAPDGGSADFDNLGTQPGYVTVSFSQPISDGAGNDIWMHHEDFTTISQSGAAEAEPFTLFGSADGVNFVALGSRTPTAPAIGLSSVFGFDIAGRLPNVRYVKVQNDTVVAEHPFEGPEIDAFEAAYFEGCTSIPTPPDVISVPPGSGLPPASGETQCSDSVDNDNDGRIDAEDPACHSDRDASNPATYVPTLTSENDTECSDLQDNDNDGRIDAEDPLCHTDFNASNPQTYNPALDREAEGFDPGGVREID